MTTTARRWPVALLLVLLALATTVGACGLAAPA